MQVATRPVSTKVEAEADVENIGRQLIQVIVVPHQRAADALFSKTTDEKTRKPRKPPKRERKARAR
jgi:hypothetical protein